MMPHYDHLGVWDANLVAASNPSAHGQSFETTLMFGDSFSFVVENAPNPATAIAALSPLVHNQADPIPIEEVTIVYESIEWTYNGDGSADLTGYAPDSRPGGDGLTTIHVDDPSVQSLRDALVQLVADADLLT